MSQVFSQIRVNRPKTNKFDLTHDRKLSTKFGQLTPIFLADAVPGDLFKIRTSVMLRLAPMLAPIMHRATVYCHFFFVPNRILWPSWEAFITGGNDGMDASVAPYLQVEYGGGMVQVGSLYDYMGVPTEADVSVGGSQYNISALPFAAYQMIFNEYYRDQNLQTDDSDYWIGTEGFSSQLANGDNAIKQNQLTKLRKRAWQHDYFTSALPFTQKGPEALLPLGETAPIFAFNNGTIEDPNLQIVRDSNDSDPNSTSGVTFETAGDGGLVVNSTDSYIDLNGTHYTDLSQATASSINDLRQAFRLQEWLEKNARGGSRYIENIMSHFGVAPKDERLQRPEYIGGFASPVKISEVLQTSNNDTQTTPQANMAGHGVSFGSGGYKNYFCREHGYVMGIMSVMPKTAYQQGIPKHLQKFDKFDYFWPSFAHLGEQPVFNRELYLDGADGEDDDVFGYLPRYAEYKFMNDSVHGDFRSTLDFWHMGRVFGSRPHLNEDFIMMDETEVNRIFAVQTAGDDLWCHILNDVQAIRPMPVFGTPKGI